MTTFSEMIAPLCPGSIMSSWGRECVAYCPLCGKYGLRAWPNHPIGKGVWWCQACKRRGDENALAQAMGHHLTVDTASRKHKLSTKIFPSLEWRQLAVYAVLRGENNLRSENGTRARQWLSKERGINEKTLGQWRIGYMPRETKIEKITVPRGILLPCFVEKQIMYIAVRRPITPPEYEMVRGGRPAIFGLNHLTGKDTIIICRTELEAVLVWQEMHPYADVVAAYGDRTTLADWFTWLLGAQRWITLGQRPDLPLAYFGESGIVTVDLSPEKLVERRNEMLSLLL